MRNVGIAGLILLVGCLLILGPSSAFAQATKVVIKVEGMNPGRAEHMGITEPADNSFTASSLNFVGRGYVVWLSGWDVTGDTAFKVGSSYTWNLTPAAGSSATLDSSGTQWNSFVPDTTGDFVVQVTVDGKDTSVTIKVRNYVGVDRSSVTNAPFPNCKPCHSSYTQYTDWATSGHATMFEGGMNGTVSSHWGASCLPCHTTGYNLSAEAVNGGFDDVAAANGFALSDSGAGGYWIPFRATNYDSLKGLSNGEQLVTLLGGITCENCHGPFSGSGAPGHQAKSMDPLVCAQCHNEPWRHNIYSMYENSLHAEAVWSTSFVGSSVITAPGGYSFSACIRCHDGQGFVSFTKGEDFDRRASSGYGFATQTKITCQTCHEPHSTALRAGPSAADTLGNGYSYSSSQIGKGMVCANCHKYRRDSDSYVFTNLSSHWGPHHGGATDVFLGQNAQKFGQSVPNINVHKFITDACVGCHMSATVDTGQVARDKIGGHSWAMEYEEGGQTYDNVTGCVSCHVGITSFDDIMASEDYDGDGTIEPAMKEVEGLLEKVAMELPPIGSPTIDYTMLDDVPADSAFNRMAYWNYLYVSEGSGHGAHNPIFVVGLLQTTYNILTGQSSVELVNNEIPTEFDLGQNYPNPFNPTTEIRFAIPKAAPVLLEVYDVTGRVVATLVNGDLPAGNHRVTWNATARDGSRLSSGMYLYRISAGDFVSTKKMVLLK